MKYILLILYRVLQFIFFCILAILAKLWGVVWLGKFKYHIKTDLMMIDNYSYYRKYYKSFWDAALGRVSFIYINDLHTGSSMKKVYPSCNTRYHSVGYVTVKGKLNYSLIKYNHDNR